MSWTSACLYWVPMFIVWGILAAIIAATRANKQDAMTRGELAIIVVMSLLPVVNVILAVCGIIYLLSSDEVQKWFSTKV